MSRNRFTVKAGVNEELDEKRRVHNGLSDLLQKIAVEEIENLPDFMTQCVMVYVPQIGYLLAVQPWNENWQKDVAENEFPNLQFMFSANGVPHFKTPRCKDLDETVGDTATMISEQETTMMFSLTKFILGNSDKVKFPAYKMTNLLLNTLLTLDFVAHALFCPFGLSSVFGNCCN